MGALCLATLLIAAVNAARDHQTSKAHRYVGSVITKRAAKAAAEQLSKPQGPQPGVDNIAQARACRQAGDL